MKNYSPGLGALFIVVACASIAVSIWKATTGNCGQRYPVDRWLWTEMLCK